MKNINANTKENNQTNKIAYIFISSIKTSAEVFNNYLTDIVDDNLLAYDHEIKKEDLEEYYYDLELRLANYYRALVKQMEHQLQSQLKKNKIIIDSIISSDGMGVGEIEFDVIVNEDLKDKEYETFKEICLQIDNIMEDNLSEKLEILVKESLEDLLEVKDTKIKIPYIYLGEYDLKNEINNQFTSIGVV